MRAAGTGSTTTFTCAGSMCRRRGCCGRLGLRLVGSRRMFLGDRWRTRGFGVAWPRLCGALYREAEAELAEDTGQGFELGVALLGERAVEGLPA